MWLNVNDFLWLAEKTPDLNPRSPQIFSDTDHPSNWTTENCFVLTRFATVFEFLPAFVIVFPYWSRA